jgi:hypothetical protein
MITEVNVPQNIEDVKVHRIKSVQRPIKIA